MREIGKVKRALRQYSNYPVLLFFGYAKDNKHCNIAGG